MIGVCLCTIDLVIIPSCSNRCKNLMMVLFDFSHFWQRKETDAIIWPLFNVKRCESCMTFLSSQLAISNKSNHHLNFSASWKIQWLMMSLLIFIHPLFIFQNNVSCLSSFSVLISSLLSIGRLDAGSNSAHATSS